MPLYRLYGLRVAATAELPGLDPVVDDGPVDVRLVLGALPPGADAPLPHPPSWHTSPRADSRGVPMLDITPTSSPPGHRLRYADGTEFVVEDDGGAVWCRWPGSLSLRNACTYLLGPVMGFLLRRRGLTCLHASAVRVDGGAVLLVGDSGAGKSTTAAALAARGFPVLADDLCALERDGDGLRVRSAYPHLRLWPDSAEALYGADQALPPLSEGWDKRYVDLDRAGAFHSATLPICAVYLLHARTDDPARPLALPMRPGDALASLIPNVYMADLPDREARARDLGVLAALVRAAPVRALLPHDDPARLDALCSALLADVRRAER